LKSTFTNLTDRIALSDLYGINLMSIFSPPATLEQTSEVDREPLAIVCSSLYLYPLNSSEVPLAKRVVKNFLF
jgi:hypothetical protein